MKLKNQYGMTKIIPNCPQCDVDSLYCGSIPTSIESLKNKEVIFCKNCKFVISVDDLKKMLFRT